MWQQILPGLRIKLFMTVLLGVGYPLLMTGVSQVLFPHQANGSLITAGDKVVGSELIGQSFTRVEYFQSRPSNAGANGYDATASSGYNQGPTNKKLVDRVTAAVAQFHKDNPDYQGPIPADLVTGSASGLDPHLSPDAAAAQAARIAKLRGTSINEVNTLVAQFTEGPDLGILGEPRVNVLRLNLALDQKFGKPPAPPAAAPAAAPAQ
jgi:potassium-transporting ATPase KdpC subunit